MSNRTTVVFVGGLGLAVGLALLFSCGGTALVDPGVGGAGGNGSTMSTSSSGSSSGSSTSSSSSSSTSSSGGQPCEGLPEAACIAAYPSCAPLYDDSCCPTCDPGPCADCIAFAFHSCVQAETVCVTGKPSCGVVPEWACSGAAASCGWDGPCQATPGCVQGQCSPMMGCPCIPEQDCSCRAVTAKSCVTPDCDAPPPPCPPGFVAESDGFCYTDWCIPVSVCGS